MKKETQYLPEKQVVERLGVQMEKMDVPPVHARIFVLLLLVDPPHLSFEEIQEYLQVSKSSVSKYINAMLERGMMDYKTFSGDRKRYFYLKLDDFLDKIYSGASKFSTISNLMENCLTERKDIDSPEFNEKIRKIADCFTYVGQNLERLMKEYSNKHST